MAGPVFFDRVKETTTTTGTGSFSLAGAASGGFRTWSSVLNTNDLGYYCCENPGAGEWEVGLGTLTGSTTLARTQVLGSSNSGSAVSFSAGTKNVFLTLPALLANGLRDLCINGNFAYWQSLGTTPGAILGNTYDLYTGADQWKANNPSRSGSHWTPAQATGGPRSDTYLTLTNGSGGTDQIMLWQPLESWLSRQLSNQQIPLTIRCWIKVSSTSGTPTAVAGLVQFSGTADALGGNGGSGAGDVAQLYTTWSGSDPSVWASNYSLAGKGAALTLSTSWQLLTATLTPSTGQVNLLPAIWLETGIANTQSVSIADVQIFPAQPVVIPSPDLLSVYRFYQYLANPPMRGIASGASSPGAEHTGCSIFVMRITPSASITGTLYALDGGTLPQVTGISTSHCTPQSLDLDLNTASALVGGRAAVILAAGSTDGILLDARL